MESAVRLIVKLGACVDKPIRQHGERGFKLAAVGKLKDKAFG